MTEIQPTGSKVCILPDPPEKKLGNSILDIPDSAKEKPQRGKLVSAGETCTPEMKAGIGRKVVYKKHRGIPIPTEEGEHILLTDDDVWAFISK